MKLTTIKLNDKQLIEYIFKDHINPNLWQELHISKPKNSKKFYVSICGEFNGSYLIEIQKYFNVLSLYSPEERVITLILEKRID